MAINFSGIGIAIIISVLILSAAIETVLCGTWNRMYFTSGLPLFVMRIPVERSYTNIPLSSRFEKQFHSPWTSALVFREIDSNTYGFREKLFESRFIFRYPSVMHGMLFFDSVNNQVIVKGFADWSNLCFSLILIASFLLKGVTNFPDFALIALFSIFIFFLGDGLLYSIQHFRFSNVATFAAQEWTRKHLINMGGA